MSFNIGWRILINCIHQSILEHKAHSGFHDLFLKPSLTLFGEKIYGKPFGIKRLGRKDFSTMQKIAIFRIDFKEEHTGIQFCNGQIDEKAKHLYT